MGNFSPSTCLTKTSGDWSIRLRSGHDLNWLCFFVPRGAVYCHKFSPNKILRRYSPPKIGFVFQIAFHIDTDLHRLALIYFCHSRESGNPSAVSRTQHPERLKPVPSTSFRAGSEQSRRIGFVFRRQKPLKSSKTHITPYY